MDESDSDVELNSNFFEEPEGFLPSAPQPTLVKFTRDINEQEVDIRLIGQSALYGHILTHGSRFLANYLDSNASELIKGKTVLEVGAGGALPSIICGLNDASKVVITDYPDPELIQNIQYNIDNNEVCKDNCVSMGYIWGNDTAEMTQELQKIGRNTFDLIILCDVIFNHTEHFKLLDTCKSLLSKTGTILVVFTPHRPHLLQADLNFFEKAQLPQYSFEVKLLDMVKRPPLFEKDKDESTVEIRSRVYLYALTFK